MSASQELLALAGALALQETITRALEGETPARSALVPGDDDYLYSLIGLVRVLDSARCHTGRNDPEPRAPREPLRGPLLR